MLVSTLKIKFKKIRISSFLKHARRYKKPFARIELDYARVP